MRRFLISFASLLVFAALAVGLWEVLRPSNKEANTNSPKPVPLPEPITYETKPQVGYLAPNFSLKTVEGREVRLADYLGKVVILDWWATWCPLCETQYETLLRFGLLTQRDVVVLMVNRAEVPEEVEKFVSSRGASPNFHVLLDPDDSLYSLYKAKTMPYLVFIDRDGVVRAIGDREMTISDINNAALPLRLSPAACWQEGRGKTC